MLGEDMEDRCYAPNQVQVGSDQGPTRTQHGDRLGFSGVDHCANLGLRVLYFSSLRIARMSVDVGVTQRE